MAVEADTKEIEYFTLEVIRTRPQAGERLQVRIASIQQDLDTDPLLARNRKKVVNHLEPGIRGIPVDAGDVGEEFEFRLRIIPEQGTCFTQRFTFQDNRELVPVPLRRFYRVRAPPQQHGKCRIVLQYFYFGDCRLECHRLHHLAARRLVPVQRALLPYIEEACQNDPDVYHHLPEAEHTQLFQSDSPRVQEDCFDVEQDEQHGHEVELHGEATTNIANRSHTAFIWRHLRPVLLMLTDHPR